MNAPLTNSEIRNFKKEMKPLLEDPLGSAEQLEQFLGSSFYTWAYYEYPINRGRKRNDKKRALDLDHMGERTPSCGGCQASCSKVSKC